LHSSSADEPLLLTPHTFDDVLKRVSPAVGLSIRESAGGKAHQHDLELVFDSIRSFDPPTLVQQIPTARSLAQARRMIVDRLHGRGNGQDLIRSVSSALSEDPGLPEIIECLKRRSLKTPPHRAVAESILSQLDLGDEGEPPTTGPSGATPGPSSPVSSLIAAAGGAGTTIPPEEAAALREAIQTIDRRISCLVTAALHAPEVRAIESAWRALHWVVSGIDFRSPIKLSVLHASKAAVVERLASKVIDPVFDGDQDAPNVIALDMSFENNATDVGILDEIAQHAASLPAVVLVGALPGLFGVKFSWQVATLPPLVNLFDQWQFAKWRTLRAQPYAQSLGVVFGQCLLRQPHAPSEVGGIEFKYQEPVSLESDLPWCSGALAAAGLIARSVTQTGWPCAIAGRANGRVERLPRVERPGKAGQWIGPTDVALPEPRIEELGMAGLNALACVADREEAIFWNGLTVAKPRKANSQSILEVSLPYQLFAGRLSSLLWALKPTLAGKPASELPEFVRTHVTDWIQGPADLAPEAVKVAVTPDPQRPGNHQLSVTVTPPASILPGGIPITLGIKIEGQ
jgi:type VI secretion system protein ImpC